MGELWENLFDGVSFFVEITIYEQEMPLHCNFVQEPLVHNYFNHGRGRKGIFSF